MPHATSSGEVVLVGRYPAVEQVAAVTRGDRGRSELPAEAGDHGVHDRTVEPAGVIAPDQIEQHLGRNRSTATLQEHHKTSRTRCPRGVTS